MKQLAPRYRDGSARLATFGTMVFWLVIFVLALGVLVGLLAGSVNSWVGARDVPVFFRLVSRETGEPVRGAEVELIHPWNDEIPAVKGRSAADGRLVLTTRFWAGGTEVHGLFRTRSSEHVTFSPWLIRVRAEGFVDYQAALAEWKGPPEWQVTDEPLRLKYPLHGPVTITLKEKSLHEPGVCR